VEGRPPDESGLVERAKRGDARAIDELVHRHQGIAVRTAHVITGDAAEAEDAAQDAFVKAFRALGRFRSGRPFRPWLLAIVANEARNRRRSAGRRTGLALRAAAQELSGEEGGFGSPTAPSPEAALLERERRLELLSAVEGLGEGDRLVLACRYFLGLSEEETAAAIGVRRGTVKSRTSRALERLRGRMGEPA
jgi:RNA polymerase sigma-70 factor (ECF subfamily)